jgi:hypothetical protein
MDATVLLTYEHRCLEELFDEFLQADTSDETRGRLAGRIVRAVAVHAGIEDAVLHPAMVECLPNGAALADLARQEHRRDLRLLASLPDPDVDRQGWRTTLELVIERTRTHAADEEARLLPALVDAIGPDGMADLGERLEQARRAVPTTPTQTLAVTAEGSGALATNTPRVELCGSPSEPTTPATP